MQILQFIAGIGLGYIAYQAALFVTGYLVTRADSLEDFARSMLSWTYAMIAAVFCTYAVVGPAAASLIAFAIAHAMTMSMIDVEETYEHNRDL